MATVGQIYYNIIDANSGGYISSGQDIFSDIVAAYGAKQFNKLGIQAPPGTQVVLNASKSIMIGRTGMYELDSDISITNMYFIKPKKYQKNEEATKEALEKGTADIIAADEVRENELQALAEDYLDGPPPQPTEDSTEEEQNAYEAYWNRYNTIQDVYIKSYQAALILYNQGVNGIYELDPINPEQDLFNIIVDFIYE